MHGRLSPHFSNRIRGYVERYNKVPFLSTKFPLIQLVHLSADLGSTDVLVKNANWKVTIALAYSYRM